MAYYLDTSVLVPLYAQEARTSDAQNWIESLGLTLLAVSPWGITEFSSALSIKTRRGELTPAELAAAADGFRNFVANRLRMLPIAARDYYCAAELCDRWQVGLRAGDALHLAVAERYGLIVCTLDKGMWTAAQALGLPFETF
jgi:predicted nucleic acid-binding protein